MYKFIKKDLKTNARRGQVVTAHGIVNAPFFMPVGTNGTVKSLLFEDLHQMDAEIMLSNTYHLFLRPGTDIIGRAGGLHKFGGWNKPILTDSGGFQVFSLADLRKLNDEGVEFKSHIDGLIHFFTPEKVIEIEQILGSDMIMPLDECAPYPCEYDAALKSVERTTLWAKRSRKYFLDNKTDKQQFLLGIIQGATYKDLRERSAQELLEIGFDSYAIGGVSVGEPIDEMFKTLDYVIHLLPEDKARYFMGIGLPDQIVLSVSRGIDMFDTCIPTRFGRHGAALTYAGKKIILNAQYADDFGPIDDKCDCIVCKNYSKSYIRHLIKQKEMSGLRLVSYHNVYFYVSLMRKIRQAIEEDRYLEFAKEFLKEYKSDLINYL